MVDKEKREKVLQGLALCTAETPPDGSIYRYDFCIKCPYHDPVFIYCFNKNVLMKDALEVIKEQAKTDEMEAADSYPKFEVHLGKYGDVKKIFMNGRELKSASNINLSLSVNSLAEISVRLTTTIENVRLVELQEE